MKVGRNDICPCGSGKKFKRCHLTMPPLGQSDPRAPPVMPPHILRQFEEQRLQEEARVATFGEIRPMVQIQEYAGYRLVGVRNRLYCEKKEKWKFFTDFLLHYGLVTFGQQWLDQQKVLSTTDQHPAYIWRKQAYAFMQRQTARPDGIFAATPNGPMAAVNNLYYDLYTVDDNSRLDDFVL
jgi:hypothetical protein